MLRPAILPNVLARVRNWCFTVQNPTPVVRAYYGHLLGKPRSALLDYFIFQEEQGTDADGTHLQGYAEFRRPVRLSRVQAVFGRGCHCEVRRGSQAQCIAYCKKAETRVQGGLSGEWGMPKAPRGRTKSRVRTCARAIQEGATMDQVREEFPGVMLQHGAHVLDAYLRGLGNRDWAMDVVILVGPTGSGKSTTAKAENEGAYHCPWPTGGRWWWPMYEGEFCVILDEFRHQIKMDVMLKLLDRHPMGLEAKGRSFRMVSKKLVITTNIDPCNWYTGVNLDVLAPLQRRIREFGRIFDMDGVPEDYPDFPKVERLGVFSFSAVTHQPDAGAVLAANTARYDFRTRT